MNWLYLKLKNGEHAMINFARVNKFYPSAHEGLTTVEFSPTDYCIVDMTFDELMTCLQEAEAAH